MSNKKFLKDSEHYYKPENKGNKWLKKDRIITVVFLIFIAFYLLTEHKAHTFQALPWLIILACPVVHIFMHKVMHKGHDRHGNSKNKEEDQ